MSGVPHEIPGPLLMVRRNHHQNLLLLRPFHRLVPIHPVCGLHGVRDTSGVFYNRYLDPSGVAHQVGRSVRILPALQQMVYEGIPPMKPSVHHFPVKQNLD